MSDEDKPKRGRPAVVKDDEPKDAPLSELLVEVEKPRNLTREMLAVEVGEKRAFEMIPE